MIGIGKDIPVSILHEKEERTWTRTHTVPTRAPTTATNSIFRSERLCRGLWHGRPIALMTYQPARKHRRHMDGVEKGRFCDEKSISDG